MKNTLGLAFLFGMYFLCEPVFAEEEKSFGVSKKAINLKKTESPSIVEVEIIGLGSTKCETILDLLPRPLQTIISEMELLEFLSRVKRHVFSLF